ncbi:DUF1549 domain-containing protein [Aureliella helgolandensis]|uniref:WD domain, G-beta repeat n=1 Tax=Aureliella helgolandensis TaxID=2527968 RepID=A0A518G8L5_9BACT|nr:DUF1549 domain-containing protein [Aureliella helgolandensis]QDV24928.1 WD domain, G-beta repeat [Aureliella helgolandensis]
MTVHLWLKLLMATFCVVGFSIGRVSQAAESGAKISYQRQIEPIFRNHCQGCHQPAKSLGGFEMTQFEHLLGVGESGEQAIVPGAPDQSHLLRQITPVDGEADMPKDQAPLNAADIELIAQWIAEGAVSDQPDQGPKYTADSPPEYTRAPLISALAYSKDGQWIAVSGFQEVLLLNADTLAIQQRLIGLSERIESLDFSPDSTKLAVTGGIPGELGEVQLWEVASGELLLSHQVGYDTVYGGAFSPDGSLIAFGCTDNTVRAIDAQTGMQRLHQGAHDDWISACEFTPDGKHLLSAGRDMTVKLTEVETERFVDNITSITPGALRGGIYSLSMHPERTEVFVGGADGIPKVYRVFRETERRIGDDANLIRQYPAMQGRIFSAEISPNGKYLAAVSTLDGTSWLHVYPYDFDGELPEDVKEAMSQRVTQRTPEQKKLIDEYTNQISTPVFELELAGESLYRIAFSPSGDRIVLGGNGGQLHVLAVPSGERLWDTCPFPLNAEHADSVSSSSHLAATTGLPPEPSSLPKETEERAGLPDDAIVELLVSPTQIELASVRDSVQLVVTAIYESGQRCDVTRLATLTSPHAAVTLSPLGVVRLEPTAKMPCPSEPLPLTIQWGSQSIQVPFDATAVTELAATDFIRDVNPLISRLGCNSGTCHGGQKGKNGFKLSLRGYDPLEDLRALSDDLVSRRLNTAEPDASLMLLKPLGKVPHEGGVLYTEDSVYYSTFRDWIAQGASLNRDSAKVAKIELYPNNPVIEREGSWQQFRVVAHYPDGTTRDVTQEAFIESGNSEVCKSFQGGRVQGIRRGEAPILARYEGTYAAATVTVMGDRSGFEWQPQAGYNRIDELVATKWERMKLLPSEVCEDHVFLRRVYLDLVGLPPTGETLKAFLSDPRPSRTKRRDLIDSLIGSPDYVDHWTNKWADLLQVNSKFIGSDGAKAFRDWIRHSIDTNQPYDEFAREILTASGSNKENPPASYYKILRDPDMIMENTTHLFLAVRFNCNKCHDHPFERWTQDQYYEMAAFFAQTALKEDPASEGKKLGGSAIDGAKPLYEEVVEDPQGQMLHIRTGKEVAPAFPYDCEFECDQDASRRDRLAAWITSPDNRYFAASFVNRLWGYMTGTGLITPLDDIRAGNPPTNPELLEHLTREFVDSDFDVEHIIRLICNSRTYQLSIATHAWNAGDSINYSHAKARRLPAEVLYDTVYRVTGAVSSIPGVEPGTRAASLPDVAVQLEDGFLNNLGRPVRESACECERSDDLQLGPIMALVSGPTIGKAISDPLCALPKMAATELTEDEMVREIYLRILCREASDEEVATVLKAAEDIATDHQQMTEHLSEKEHWWEGERARLEAERLEALAVTEKAIVDRTAAIAEQRAQLERERLERIASVEEALADYGTKATQRVETYLENNSVHPNWYPLSASSLAASNGATLVPQADRSIVASGKTDKGTYTLTFKTPLRSIRGFRLEALPVEGIPGGGPGLPPNGNFVVTEIELSAKSLSDPAVESKVQLASGKADFSQNGFSPEAAFDGQKEDQGGWAVSPNGGVGHWAVFQTQSPIDYEGGVELTFVIHQYHNAAHHRLAHFRLSVTTDDGEIPLGLPEEFAAGQALDASLRTAENLPALFSYLEKSDAEGAKLRKNLADAQRVVPEDSQLVALRGKAEKLRVETAEDPKLVQLRADVETSREQLTHRRLTLAQDLSWALINSPAFLFNH